MMHNVRIGFNRRALLTDEELERWENFAAAEREAIGRAIAQDGDVKSAWADYHKAGERFITTIPDLIEQTPKEQGQQ